MRAFLLALLAPTAAAQGDPSQHPPFDLENWQYFDWTKAGNGPWSDVYCRHERKVSIGAIMNER